MLAKISKCLCLGFKELAARVYPYTGYQIWSSHMHKRSSALSKTSISPPIIISRLLFLALRGCVKLRPEDDWQMHVWNVRNVTWLGPDWTELIGLPTSPRAPREMNLQMSSLLYRCQRIIILVCRVSCINRSPREFGRFHYYVRIDSDSPVAARHPRRSIECKKRKEHCRHLRQRQKQK